MILLASVSNMGSVHIQSCKVFETVADMITFLNSITARWHNFSLCPVAYELSVYSGVSKFSDEWHKEWVYPHTYNTRSKCSEQSGKEREQ
jgi:hypothetical protein